MAAAGVDERWCLGDLVGREPVTSWWLIVDIDARVMRWHRKTFGPEEAAAACL